MSDESPPWEVRARQHDALRGERMSLRERAFLGDDIDDEYGRVRVGANSDCFSCEHIRASDACALMARVETRRDLLRVIDCFEYRQSSDPHTLCEHHMLAPAVELARRCGQTLTQWNAEHRAMLKAGPLPSPPPPAPLPPLRTKPVRVRRSDEPDPDDPPPARPPRAARG